VAAVSVLSTSLEATHHNEMLGKYTTRTAESRLFVDTDDGTRLRCDLFFSAADGKTIVAAKDSLVVQQVPAFVWQFSGLLPVSDYLKTVVIHSVATDQKIDSWQDVQHTFFSGLRAEGAARADAKIAYAGAYAFAPRWPLVELVEKLDGVNIPDTKLYSVVVTNSAGQGLSVEDYRALARDILESPQDVTLQDIRGVVDAVDAGAEYEKSDLQVRQRNSQPADAEVDEVALVESKETTEASPEDWAAMPDGSELLRKVASLARKSS